ncbi:MAG: hypothetical protein KC636_16420 [Myxococcales bacterium]|nr:hypothetical protein [Myxococcales bacterium]
MWRRAFTDVTAASGVLDVDGTSLLSISERLAETTLVAIDRDGATRWSVEVAAPLRLGAIVDGRVAFGSDGAQERHQWSYDHPQAPTLEYRGGAVLGELDAASGRPLWFAAIGAGLSAWETRLTRVAGGELRGTSLLSPAVWDPHCALPGPWVLVIREEASAPTVLPQAR